MKIYKLSRRESNADFDEVDSFVVVAYDEGTARQVAAENSLREGGDFWIDPDKSDCQEIKARTFHKPTLIQRDVNWG